MKPTFAMLGHPATYEDLCRQLMQWRPDYDQTRLLRYQRTYEALFGMIDPYVREGSVSVHGETGAVNGAVVVCPFLPEVTQTPRGILTASSKVRDGIALAAETGASIIALGGFTSIVAAATGLDYALTAPGSKVITGNRLTSAFTLAQFDALIARRGMDPAATDVAIVGASGDIGSTCTTALSGRVRRLLLVGRNERKLKAIADRHNGRIETSTDTGAAASMRVIIAATSSAQPIIDEATLRPGTIVLDVGYPSSVRRAKSLGFDIVVMHAGLAQLPWELDLGYVTGLKPTLMFGCYAEAITLALHHQQTGVVATELGPDALVTLARSFGIEPAPIDDLEIDASRGSVNPSPR